MKKHLFLFLLIHFYFHCVGQNEIKAIYQISNEIHELGIGYEHNLSNIYTVKSFLSYGEQIEEGTISDVRDTYRAYRLTISPSAYFGLFGIDKKIIRSAFGFYGTIAASEVIHSSTAFGKGSKKGFEYETGLVLTFAKINIYRQRLFCELNFSQGYKFNALETIKLDRPMNYAISNSQKGNIRRFAFGLSYSL